MRSCEAGAMNFPLWGVNADAEYLEEENLIPKGRMVPMPVRS